MARLDEDVRHGEYAGVQWHARNNVPLCDECRDAGNAYQRDYRDGKRGAGGLAYRERNRLGGQARNAALSALRDNHRAEYHELLTNEKKKRGLKP